MNVILSGRSDTMPYSLRTCSVSTDAFCKHGVHHYCLLYQSVEQLATGTRCPAVEPEGAFVKIVIRVRKNNPDKAVIVVVDNLKAHKVADVKAEAERLGIELVFLPPYSPDLNPIEYIMEEHKEDYLNNLCKARR